MHIHRERPTLKYLCVQSEMEETEAAFRREVTHLRSENEDSETAHRAEVTDLEQIRDDLLQASDSFLYSPSDSQTLFL